MGRIKTDRVKRNAKKLYELDTKAFSLNFDKNKKSVNAMAEVRSKKLRNLLAGQISRIVKKGDTVRPRKPAPMSDRGGSMRGGYNRGGSGSTMGRRPPMTHNRD